MKILLPSLALLLLAGAARAEPPVPWGQTLDASAWYRVVFGGGTCYYPAAAFDAAADGAALTLYALAKDKTVGPVSVWKSSPCLLTGVTKMGGQFNNPAGPGGMEMVKGAPARGGLMIVVAKDADLPRVYKSLAYFQSPQ